MKTLNALIDFIGTETFGMLLLTVVAPLSLAAMFFFTIPKHDEFSILLMVSCASPAPIGIFFAIANRNED